MQKNISKLMFFLFFLSYTLAVPVNEQEPFPPPRNRCTAYNDCWPSLAEWDELNNTVSGRLIASRPTAAVCHAPAYDAALCHEVKQNWTDGKWRTEQVGGYSAILWELGTDQCFPWSNQNEICEQGLVAPMTVDARTVEDVQIAIGFASKHDLFLTVKNTGHDHLGRSSGDGSFAIWTHNMRGREWHNQFIPKDATSSVSGVPAVTLQAGEEWLDVYRAADAQDVIIAGGSAISVGVAGGYLLGGGHSPFSYYYGLAADNLLEMEIVTPCGKHVVLNEYTDPEYFWAVRGGGGNSWGVVMSVTYKTHPKPSHIQVAFLQANMSTKAAYRKVYTQTLKALPGVTDAGYTGYGKQTERQ
jgi:hypothetical protein